MEKIAAMEGAETRYAFATGMSAIFSTLAALLNSGDHVVSARSVFGSTHTLFTKFFPKWNITHMYFSVGEVDKIESLIKPETKILFAESPTNPGLDILDLENLGPLRKNIILY